MGIVRAIVSGHPLAISFASHGEALAFGYQRGFEIRRLVKIRAALARLVTLPYDATVAELWAPLYGKLSGHMKGGGVNDIWTAACALAQDPPLPIVTNNLAGLLQDRGGAARSASPDTP